jgi:hypothetical protein
MKPRFASIHCVSQVGLNFFFFGGTGDLKSGPPALPIEPPSSPFCCNYFSDRVWCFSLGLAFGCDSSINAFHIAGITAASHHIQLIYRKGWGGGSLTF